MSILLYNKYKKLRRYVNGIPVEPAQYKEGEFIGSNIYRTEQDCENNNN